MSIARWFRSRAVVMAGADGGRPFDGQAALLLVNPTAGRGRARRLAPRVRAALRAQGFDVSVVVTTSLDDAARFARRAGAGTVVAALGGDGFLGAVAAGVPDAGAVMLPLAGGRGNDFVRRLGHPLDPVRAIGALHRCVPSTIDVGEAAGRTFLGVANAGFDALANEYGNRARLALGPFVYLYGGVRALLRWRGVIFTLTTDGTTRSVPGWAVAVGNTGQYGGGLRICPSARIDDGLLDVVALERSSVITLIVTYLLAYRGRHTGRRNVSCGLASHVVLDADRPLTLYADGEPVTPLPAVLTVVPRALRVLLPPRRCHLADPCDRLRRCRRAGPSAMRGSGTEDLRPAG